MQNFKNFKFKMGDNIYMNYTFYAYRIYILKRTQISIIYSFTHMCEEGKLFPIINLSLLLIRIFFEFIFQWTIDYFVDRSISYQFNIQGFPPVGSNYSLRNVNLNTFVI